MKVSFDFDSTLDREDVQAFATDLVNRGLEVWITTSRFDNESGEKKGWWWISKQNQELYDVAEKCGIKKENIKFTTMVDKIVFLKDKNFIFHLDDDEIELELIEESDDSCVGIWVEKNDWKQKCENLIK
jgi:hypothetical protein